MLARHINWLDKLNIKIFPQIAEWTMLALRYVQFCHGGYPAARWERLVPDFCCKSYFKNARYFTQTVPEQLLVTNTSFEHHESVDNLDLQGQVCYESTGRIFFCCLQKPKFGLFCFIGRMYLIQKYLPKIIKTSLKHGVMAKVKPRETASPASWGRTLLLCWRRIWIQDKKVMQWFLNTNWTQDYWHRTSIAGNVV